MGHGHGPDGAHTHGSGGSEIGAAVLVILGAALVASAAGPAIHAAAELLRAVIIAAAVILGLGLASGAALVAWRLRRGRPNAPLMVRQVPPVNQRPSQALPAPQRPAIERSAEVHLHLHGLSAADIAAIIAREDGPT